MQRTRCPAFHHGTGPHCDAYPDSDRNTYTHSHTDTDAGTNCDTRADAGADP